MKTKTIIFMLLTSISSLIFAQKNSNSKNDIWWGPKFGLDAYTNTTNLNELSDQINNNYQLGVFVQMGKKIYFQPELYISTYKTSNLGGTTNYIKAPLLLGFKFIDLGLISLHSMIGPSYTKLLNNDIAGSFKWEMGVGMNLLGLITADIRYSLNKNNNSVRYPNEYAYNENRVNLTVGIRLK